MSTNDNGPIIGIDLGTTYSSVAIYRNNQPELIPNHLGHYSTASIVALTPTERKFGKDAQNHGLRKPLETLYDSKRIIGLPFAHREIQKMISKWPFKVIEQKGKPVYSIDRDNSTDTFTPVEISSYILGYLKTHAEKFLGREIKEAVITCPAYFQDNQRQATIEAAELAGLKVKRLLNEPTAAALAYGITADRRDVHYLMVFDFGGGTLDISILHLDGKDFCVKAVHGDNHCGGRDLDNALTEYLAEQFNIQSREDVHAYPRSLARLRSAAEDAKITLSSSQIATVDLPYLVSDIDFTYDLTRTDFERLYEDTFHRCIQCAQGALIDAGITADQLDKILLVGGSSRIPRVQELLKQEFGDKLSHEIHPDEAVAKGAAIEASFDPGITLVDVIPYELGVMIKDGSIVTLLDRNTPYGKCSVQHFQNATAGISSARIDVYQVINDSSDKKNAKVGSVIVDMEPGPVGSTFIDVEFVYNSDGILTVEAKNLNPRVTRKIHIERSMFSGPSVPSSR